MKSPVVYQSSDKFGAHLAIRLEVVDSNEVAGQMEIRREHLNADNKAHGGVLMSLADVVAAHATVQNLPPGMATTTIESKTNFIRAAAEGVVRATTTPIHIGRSTMVWQTTVKDSAGQTLAIVTQTQLVFQARESASAANTENAAPAAPAERVNEVPTPDANQNGTTADRKRAQILEAAFRVIADKGFAAASMREIAQESGMPVPTMYQYVRSKDELLQAIFDDYLGKIEISVQESSERSTSPTDKLRAAIQTNVFEFDRFQSQIRMVNRETRSVEGPVRERIKQHMLNYIQLYRDIIQEGIDKGEFRDVNVDLYANFIPMLCEVWPLRFWSVGRFGVEAVSDGIAEMAVRSLTVRSAT